MSTAPVKVQLVEPVATDADQAPADAVTPDEEVRARPVRAAVARSLKLLGLLVLAFAFFLVVLSPLVHGRTQRSISRTFRTELGFAQAPLGGALAEGTSVALLQIPSLGIREVVVEGTSSTQLKRGPGHLRTSPLPGQPGNAVVAGRRLAYGGPFLHLDRMHRGDVIQATTGQGRSEYVVQRVGTVSPGDADPIGPTRDSRITLVTSDPVLTASRRLVVVATMRGNPFPQPPGRTTRLQTDELGLQGQPDAARRVVFWGGALVLAGLGSVWLLRRWPTHAAYVLIAPVFLVLLVLLFDSFAGLLPATL